MEINGRGGESWGGEVGGLWWLGRRDGSAPGVGQSWAGGWAASESELVAGLVVEEEERK